MDDTQTSIFEPDHYLLTTLRTAHGELLIEVFPNGEIHIAERQHPHNSWSVGYWTTVKKVPLG